MDVPIFDGNAVLRQARQGDGDAMEMLIARIRPDLVRHARASGASDADASDAAQMTAYVIAQQLSKCHADIWTGFLAWAKTIVANEVHQIARRQPPLQSLDALAASSVALADLLASDSPTPSSHAARREAADRIRAQIKRLDERERSVIEMYYGQGLPFAEIGRRLNISDTWVAAVNKQALSALKKFLTHGQ